jgi:hypothetical protein
MLLYTIATEASQTCNKIARSLQRMCFALAVLFIVMTLDSHVHYNNGAAEGCAQHENLAEAAHACSTRSSMKWTKIASFSVEARIHLNVGSMRGMGLERRRWVEKEQKWQHREKKIDTAGLKGVRCHRPAGNRMEIASRTLTRV